MEEETKFARHYIKTMTPLYYVTRLMALTPYRFINGKLTKLTYVDRSYARIQIFITVAVVLTSFVGKCMYTYSKRHTHVTTIILDFANTVLRTILMIISIRGNLKEDISYIVLYFSKLSTISTNFKFTNKEYKNSQAKMLLKCMVVIIGTVGIAALDIWVSLKLNQFIFALCNLYQYWLFFYEFIIFIQIEVKIELIKQMYLHMNELLLDNSLEFNPKIDEYTNVKEYLTNFGQNKFNVYEIAKTYYTNGETITLINNMHGVQILAIVCSLILALLTLLNKGIIVVQSKDKEISVYTYASVVVQMLWCLCFLIVGNVISSRCSSTLRYANDTKVISQKLLLQDRPLLKGNNTDNEIFKYQLELLYNSGEVPTFSAAGFFSVDFTMIYEVMGAVTTYFIVLLQFAGVTS